MSDSLYTAPGIFLDIVDSDWVLDSLPFEDIQVNTDILPTSEPELGINADSAKQPSLERADRVKLDEQSLLLPRNPTKTRYLSTLDLPPL